MNFDPETVKRYVIESRGQGDPGAVLVAARDYDKLLTLLHDVSTEADPAGTVRENRMLQDKVAAQEIRIAELEAKRESAVDLLARYFQNQKGSNWLDEDDKINALRERWDEVYRIHRARDFTKARIEACRAVIDAALEERLKGQ
jgi:hypothetical protein